MRNQSIPGRLSPPTRPGYEATSMQALNVVRLAVQDKQCNSKLCGFGGDPPYLDIHVTKFWQASPLSHTASKKLDGVKAWEMKVGR